MHPRVSRLIRRAKRSDRFRRSWNRLLYVAWRLGRLRSVTPPAPYKQRLVRACGRRYGLGVLVETGTHLGDMVAACRGAFATIHSIELDPRLHRRAARRFARDPRVRLHQGDSGELMAEVLAAVEAPCLFWLDAHAVAGAVRGAEVTPVLRELEAIFAARPPRAAILIDDARLFHAAGGYPSLEHVRRRVEEALPGFSFAVADDVIRVLPR